MVTMVFTWIGAVLGIVVLLMMAAGAFIVDLDDAHADRIELRRAPEGTTGA